MNYKFIYIHIPVLYTLGVIEPTKINDDLQMTIRFVLSLYQLIFSLNFFLYSNV